MMVTSSAHDGLEAPSLTSRRQFLQVAVATIPWLSRLPQVSAQERDSEIESLVRLLEDTPRERVLEAVGQRVRRGLSYRSVLAALLLAGVRNIQPRPVGFKFHAVLVVHSAHLASLASPAADRWLPLFWSLDHFKRAQARDESEGDWTMGPVRTSDVPPSHQATPAFVQAMDNWDEAAADAAVAGLARAAKASDIFDLLCRYGARDFRAIGHKAIYLANGWRTLQTIGWEHAEPILRSLAYAFLAHEGTNPARRDAAADRPFRRNQQLLHTIRPGWQGGEVSVAATADMLATLRQASADEACDTVVAMLNRGIAPPSLWDALFAASAELLMRQPGIVALHAVTTTNAIHAAFQTTAYDPTRRLLLLQNAAFMTRFRGEPGRHRPIAIDQLEPEALEHAGPGAMQEIVTEIPNDVDRAVRKVLAYLRTPKHPQTFMEAARRLLVYRGSNAHDYKFASAVLEDYAHISPAWRDRYLAASVYNMPGPGRADNPLVARTRAALNG